MTNRSPQMEARAIEAAALRRMGCSLRQIADSYRCSRERARQLCLRGEELKREQEELASNPWLALHPAVRNALRRDGCAPTVDAVLERYPTLVDLRHVPALGITRIGMLQAWLTRNGREAIR